MRKIIIFLGLFFFSAFATPAEAKFIINENGNAVVRAEEIINDDLWIAGENVDIQGTVNGDVFAAGKTVTISNTSIAHSLIIGAGSISIDESSSIGGSLIAGTQTFYNRAAITRTLIVGAETIDHNGSVGGEVRVAGKTISLGDRSKILGQVFTYTSPNKNLDQDNMKRGILFVSNGFRLVSYLGAIVVGLLLLTFLKDYAFTLASHSEKFIMKYIGIGFLIALFTIPVLIVLLFTIIGAPLAYILFLLYLLGLSVSKLISAFVLGLFISKKFGGKPTNGYAEYVLGLTVLYILSIIPGIGFLVSLTATWFGLGSLCMRRKVRRSPVTH